MKRLFALAMLLSGLTLIVPAQNYNIRQYLSIKSAGGATLSPDARQMAYVTNVSGTTQVWTMDLAAAAATPRQLTNFEDNVSFVRWLPDGSGLIFGKAAGGNENTQLFRMKPDGSDITALTNEPQVRHNFAKISDDGKTIYYASNERDRNFFDIYAMDIADGRERLIYQQDGNNDLAAVSADGTKIIVSRDGTELSLDNNLYIVDVKTKSETLLTPHIGAAEFGEAAFIADNIMFTSNDNREFAGIATLQKKNAGRDDWSDKNRDVSYLDTPSWDVGNIAMVAAEPRIMAYTINRDGFSELYLRKIEVGGKPRTAKFGARAEKIELPAQGLVGGLTISKDQGKLAFSFSSATQNGDIWTYDLKSKKLAQATNSDRAGIDPSSFVTPELIKYKTFDGREIPAWYYKPQTVVGKIASKVGNFTVATRQTQNRKVIVSVHGGPEGQERPGFNPLYQYYLSRGYAILAPNVRGSTGYGKTYTHLDDVRNREDSVKDLAAAVDWLKTSGGADPKRIAVMGGSYGGYMTLAAITLYPDLWAAAVDTVGIANWESFLKNTSGYRRRQREVEYGRLDRDLDFLRSISPLAKVDRIKTPLFVIQGKNDPRVPYTEAEQIVKAVRERGGIVEYKLFDDEGHGISKLKNRLELYPLVADFLDKYLK